MRHRWKWSIWATVENRAWSQRCKCGAERKHVKRHWKHLWPGIGWLRGVPPCGLETKRDDRQRELFATPTDGEVTT